MGPHATAFITAGRVLSKVRYDNIAKANLEAVEGPSRGASEEDRRPIDARQMMRGGDGSQGMRGDRSSGDGETGGKKGRARDSRWVRRTWSRRRILKKGGFGGGTLGKKGRKSAEGVICRDVSIEAMRGIKNRAPLKSARPFLRFRNRSHDLATHARRTPGFGYQSISVKNEMRRNLLRKMKAQAADLRRHHRLRRHRPPADPQRQSSRRHHIALPRSRGQAKDANARQLVHLLDEQLPIVAGSEVNDDPYRPSRIRPRSRALRGDETPIEWIGRDSVTTRSWRRPT